MAGAGAACVRRRLAGVLQMLTFLCSDGGRAHAWPGACACSRGAVPASFWPGERPRALLELVPEAQAGPVRIRLGGLCVGGVVVDDRVVHDRIVDVSEDEVVMRRLHIGWCSTQAGHGHIGWCRQCIELERLERMRAAQVR